MTDNNTARAASLARHAEALHAGDIADFRTPENEPTFDDLARLMLAGMQATAAAARASARYAANVDTDTPRALAEMQAANLAENLKHVEMWRVFYALAGRDADTGDHPNETGWTGL